MRETLYRSQTRTRSEAKLHEQATAHGGLRGSKAEACKPRDIRQVLMWVIEAMNAIDGKVSRETIPQFGASQTLQAGL